MGNGKMIKKYRKKPVVIEAVHYKDANQQQAIIEWMENREPGYVCDIYLVGNHPIPIETLEGTMIANVGDWIIKGIAGEFYPCRNDIFQATYEEVKGD